MICCPLPIITPVIAVNLVTAGTFGAALNDRVERGQPGSLLIGLECLNCFTAENNYIIVKTLDLPVFSLL